MVCRMRLKRLIPTPGFGPAVASSSLCSAAASLVFSTCASSRRAPPSPPRSTDSSSCATPRFQRLESEAYSSSLRGFNHAGRRAKFHSQPSLAPRASPHPSSLCYGAAQRPFTTPSASSSPAFFANARCMFSSLAVTPSSSFPDAVVSALSPSSASHLSLGFSNASGLCPSSVRDCARLLGEPASLLAGVSYGLTSALPSDLSLSPSSLSPSSPSASLSPRSPASAVRAIAPDAAASLGGVSALFADCAFPSRCDGTCAVRTPDAPTSASPWGSGSSLSRSEPLECRRDRGGKTKTKLRREERRRRRAQIEKLRGEEEKPDKARKVTSEDVIILRK
ncbi:hypothetical protein BESB_047020 [Besnoitia besnoiti]|uniref:Uncharacterized protein n=1 Tax=Besnoitia besnoiti TaxID=94643 RepID=A0A2A9MLY4_BESBE|nr:hypothetical protein BESB_047020 [Besnoitia besnoiti]PFH36510.1 hypothetical protein BESB_047020 [Besnoitia besnoiti]